MEVKKIATRDGYGRALAELGALHPDVYVLDADLSEATKTCYFKEAFPDRHINCGIAEGNMMAAAAGMATMGVVPFVSTFAMFAAGRAFEQVRNSIAHTAANVKICATHGGITVGEDGATHQCNEDFALMRAVPGMTVLCPADDPEARAAVNAAYAYKGPVYIRFSRFASPVFHGADMPFAIGKGELLKDGKDVAIISTGLMTSGALEAAEMLEQEGIHARILHMATIKPLDEELVLQAARDCGRIITCEEHSVMGGLGEAVCSLLAEKAPCPVRRMGVPDCYGFSGPAAGLLEAFHLTGKDIAEVAREMVK